ncbi:MAG: AbrB/MazE/SpoVT family DNA-binding domain-containing protein [Candidatus Magasanikbacteria bacterium]
MKKNNKKEDIFGCIYGTTSLGERGQIVVPKKLREKMKMKKGDNFVVVEKHGMVALMPTEMMSDFITEVTKHLKEIKNK